MTTHIIDDKPTLEELAHYGIKGMHWGERMAKRKELRTLDKASKAKDQAARNKEIDDARERYANDSRDNYLNAKAQYKIDKKTIGKREANKKFDEVKKKNTEDFEIANQTKHGKETTIAVLSVVGFVAAKAIVGALSAAR